MVDVSDKDITAREARAISEISMSADAFEAVRSGENKKGDVLFVARVAAIQGVKQTSALIPLCHPLMISKVSVEFDLNENTRTVQAEVLVKTTGQTGVEMEALTGASIATLTVYDMLKAIDKSMIIYNTRLLEKKGGRSGHYRTQP